MSSISQEVPIEVDRMQEVNFQDMSLTFNDPEKELLTTYGNTDTTNLVGKELELRLCIDGQDGYITVFRGMIRQPFIFYRGYAELTVENIVTQFLSKELRIIAASTDPTKRLDNTGALASTITWNTGSTGTLTAPTIYAGAQLGQWTVTFTSATAFTVTGPSCQAKVGATDADFYDATDATDSQIKIATTNWGGTPTTGDIVYFFVSANIGKDFVTKQNTLANGVYELLVDYGGLSSSLIDYGGTGIDDYSYVSQNSFNLAYYVYNNGLNPVMSFDTPITILEACLQFLQHVCGTLVQMLNGKIRIFTHYLFSEQIKRKAGHVISLNSHLLSEITNEIVVLYGWDYTNQTYLYSYKYPETDAANASFIKYGKKKVITLYMPGYYSSGLGVGPQAIATGIYDKRHDPLRLHDLVMALDSIHLDIYDTFDMDANELALVLDTGTADNLFVYAYNLDLISTNRINLKVMDTVAT